MNGDGLDDAAAILWSFVGGSGSLVEWVLMVQSNTEVLAVAAGLLGNGIGVENILVKSGRVQGYAMK